MSDSDNNAKKDTLKVGKPNRLQLTKTVESGKVKQNFTHGRSKTVTVEVRKTRTFTQGKRGAPMVEVKKNKGILSSADIDDPMSQLTPEERESRLKALKLAEERQEYEKNKPQPTKTKDEDDGLKNDKEAGEKTDTINEPVEVEKKPKRRSDITIPAPSGIVTPIKARQSENEKPKEQPSSAHKLSGKSSHDFSDGEESNKKEKSGKLRLRGGEDRRSSGKITVHQALSNIEEQRVRSLASIKRAREKALKKAMNKPTESEKVIREVVIPETINVSELANRMAERTVDVIKSLMKLGIMATASQSIDADTAELVVGEFGHKFKRVTEGDVENILKDDEGDDAKDLRPRPPIVTIMGHVDHGKTSLLDALRMTDVVAKEAGGITQHIGAYQVSVENGQKVTFLDTPGHEAFTAMRARGAKITDIVILVVAADDGIMEQTKEAINHAKAAEVPIVVAINKIDKVGADPARVKQELMQYNLIAEEFGGDVMVVEISAKTRQNLDKLVEALLLQAEILELKANPDRMASGIVVEAKLDQGKGVVATILIQKGTLKVGDVVVAGIANGKVRNMLDDKGNPISEAIPGTPVVILGLNTAPDAGDIFSVVENEKVARDISEYRTRTIREKNVALSTRSLDNLFGEAAGTGAKELPVIIKADVHGSVEAIASSITKYSDNEVAVRVLHSAVGGISESDITLAKSTGALIIAFNVRAAPKAKELAAKENINIRYYSIIYNVVDDVKAMLSGMLSPILKENFLGYAQIREVFNISKIGKVAGCIVTEGIIKRGAKVRLLRDNVVIHEGALKTLKRFKDEVKEVKSGLECGMAFENYDDIRADDQIEAFEIEETARTI
ncbi:MAG: translation initiation factor IF-2 [Rickettsiales bacterium]